MACQRQLASRCQRSFSHRCHPVRPLWSGGHSVTCQRTPPRPRTLVNASCHHFPPCLQDLDDSSDSGFSFSLIQRPPLSAAQQGGTNSKCTFRMLQEAIALPFMLSVQRSSGCSESNAKLYMDFVQYGTYLDSVPHRMPWSACKSLTCPSRLLVSPEGLRSWSALSVLCIGPEHPRFDWFCQCNLGSLQGQKPIIQWCGLLFPLQDALAIAVDYRAVSTLIASFWVASDVDLCCQVLLQCGPMLPNVAQCSSDVSSCCFAGDIDNDDDQHCFCSTPHAKQFGRKQAAWLGAPYCIPKLFVSSSLHLACKVKRHNSELLCLTVVANNSLRSQQQHHV